MADHGQPSWHILVLSTSQVHYYILKHTLILFILHDISQIRLMLSTSPILDLTMAVDSYFFKALALLVFLSRSRSNLKSFFVAIFCSFVSFVIHISCTLMKHYLWSSTPHGALVVLLLPPRVITDQKETFAE